MDTWKIYYEDGASRSGSTDFPDEIWGVEVILHNPMNTGWVTQYGGDFYMLENASWMALGKEGLVHRLVKKGLMRPKIGTVHDVLEDGEWIGVNEIGLYAWIDKNRIALVGTMMSDEAFGSLMAIVLDDMHYAREYGHLPE